ncbi:Origin recognition complex subunit 2 [Coemansia sp. RSA 2336]|nr:Origin recognition complex subunit 2 [Coemansia sp. RSA 2336]
MKDNDNRMTPHGGARTSTRFDMGMTLSTTGRKPLLTDSVHNTPTRASTSEITDILKLGAVVEAEDKENSSEETTPRHPSLTENAKGIFRILAEYQIAEAVMDKDAADTQNKSGSNMPEMPYSSYFTACRDQFLVTNEMTFHSQLTEFRDHKVIQSRHAPDGTEFVFIQLSATVLGTIIESMD